MGFSQCVNYNLPVNTTGAAVPEGAEGGGGGRAAERGGEERGKELVRTGVAGSQRESRSGLLRRGTGAMSASGHAPRTPEEGTEEAGDARAEAKVREGEGRTLPDSTGG